jgi:hypothetical protein
MADKENDARNKSGDPADTDESLEKELAREAAEGADSIGDVGSNRTLSGSSSWETLPDSAGGNAKTGKEPSEKKE